MGGIETPGVCSHLYIGIYLTIAKGILYLVPTHDFLSSKAINNLGATFICVCLSTHAFGDQDIQIRNQRGSSYPPLRIPTTTRFGLPPDNSGTQDMPGRAKDIRTTNGRRASCMKDAIHKAGTSKRTTLSVRLIRAKALDSLLPNRSLTSPLCFLALGSRVSEQYILLFDFAAHSLISSIIVKPGTRDTPASPHFLTDDK
ncbi:hypothetical protein H2248_011475 [Termitomyces sp. 'cryptogamus']|nr:hypothetical protein H2248_011475 [Termitomyces sp. 'cryptogamus']